MSEYAVMPLADYKNACDRLREIGKTEDPLKSGDLVTAINMAYDTGLIQGSDIYYNAFWDNFQRYGTRTIYGNAFGSGWNTSLFQPKYDLIVTNGYMMFFHNTEADKIVIDDFVEFCNARGIRLDISGASNLNYCFYALETKRFGCLSVISATGLGNFLGWKVETIDELVSSEKTKWDSTTFKASTKLANVTMSGTIGNSIYFQYNPLTVDSMKSIISCLKDYVGTDNEGVNAVKFSSACWEALEASGPAPHGGTWQNYIIAIKGWLV